MSIPKLSEAIRLGAMMRSQSDACALQAAFLSIGREYNRVCWEEAKEAWPWLAKKYECPVSGGGVYGDSIILYLNDACHWTRERIAAWVATIEPSDEPTATKEPACESTLNVSR